MIMTMIISIIIMRT